MPEANLKQTEAGLVPDGDGWYVINARDAPWVQRESLGSHCDFEGDVEWPHMGLNICVLEPGMPNCMYHRESLQEGFLVIAGECRLLVEGEERRMRRWDYFHCPPWIDHVFVGAGDSPCVIVMAGGRGAVEDEVFYPVNELAQKYGASALEDTPHPREAYARFTRRGPHAYPHGDLLPPG
jgi:uncharacterized cupin superfamily protein